MDTSYNRRKTYNISHLAKNEESQRKYVLLVCNGWAEELIAVNKRKNGEIHLTTDDKHDISRLAKKIKRGITNFRKYIVPVCNGCVEVLVAVRKRERGSMGVNYYH